MSKFERVNSQPKELKKIKLYGYFVLKDNLEQPYLKLSNSDSNLVLNLNTNETSLFLPDTEVFEAEMILFRYDLKVI